MKFLYAIAGAGAVAGGVHYSGVLDRGEVYDKPYSVVYAELVTMPIPDEAETVVGGEVRMTQAPAQIAWHFSNKQGEVAVFTASLTREDNRHTRVKVDFKTAGKVDDPGGELLSTELIRSTARSAMAEQVDARLSGRPFDQSRMGKVLAEHLRDHPEELKAYGQSLEHIFQNVSEQMKTESGGTFSHAAGDGDYGSPTTHETMAAATRPTTQLSPQ